MFDRATGLAVVVVVCWGSLASAADESAPRRGHSPPRARRGIHQIDVDVHETLRMEASAEGPSERETAIRRLVRLHEEIARHDKLFSSKALQRSLLRVRGRLRRLRNELRETSDQRVKGRIASRRRSSTPRPAHAGPRRLVLAQQGGVNRAPRAPVAPGPAVLGRAVPLDNGPDLVALIERTITPNIWEVSGGPATIVYYAPQRALVVRAPSEIHYELVSLLEDLR